MNWPEFFSTLRRLNFNGIMTVCVFAWEDRARESCIYNRQEIEKYVKGW